MKKAEKIALAIVTALTLVNCGTDVTLVLDTSSHSLQTPLLGRAGVGSTHYSPIKEDFTALAKKYNFAELEKEYKAFSTKALADTYVKKMFNKFLIVTPNSVQVIRQVEFSRYLKNNGDTSYETSLKNIFTDTPVLYSSLTGMAAVQSKMTSESGTFGFYILGVSPNQTVPTALPATNITETSFTANWSAVTGATSYTLIVDGVEITGITGTNHTLNSLTAGSNHKYRVKAITSGVAGAASNEINVNTVLTAPEASSATGVTQISLTANWSAVLGATSYTLIFNGTETAGITGTSHTVNTLTPGTSYSYYVKAVNANTESVYSGTINTVTVPSNPTATAATNITQTSFTANWDASGNATGYKLIVDNGTPIILGNVTSYNVTGFLSGSHYYYVQSVNDSGTSSDSNTVNVTLNSLIGEFRVNTYTSDKQFNPTVGMSDDGKSAVAWISNFQDSSGYGIYFQRYDASGNKLGDETRVNTFTNLHQSEPCLAMGSDGKFVVSWTSEQDGSGYGVFAQRFDVNGAKLGSEFQVNTYTAATQDYSYVAVGNDGKFVIVWRSDGQDGNSSEIYAQRFDANGTKLGSEFRVNSYITNSQILPVVAVANDGKFVVSWSGEGQSDSSGVYAKRFNSDGTPIGPEFLVNTYTDNAQDYPAIAMTNDGKFVISWTSNAQDGESFGIFAQRFNADGTKSGSEIPVNTYTSSAQSDSTIAIDNNGNFVIAWHSYIVANSNREIHAQRFDSNGNTIGSQFQVNTYITDNQWYPWIAMNKTNGKFVITWHSTLQDASDHGVYGQIFDSNGNAL